jgi:gliding-associated putative ABC transporter substrate-binding component GldG
MKKNFLKSSNGSVIIVLAFLVAVNFLVSQKSLYLDLTEEKLYTPSDTSKEILSNLEKPVSVTFYISGDLPADYLTFKTQISDVVNQYQDLSGGKLEVKYEEPSNDEAVVTELAQKGIPQLQGEVVQKDKIEVKLFFFGAVIADKGDETKKEVMQVVPSLESFEYSFISAIYSVSKDKEEVLALLSGHDEKDIEISEFKKSYEVQKVLISTDESKKGFYISTAESSSEGAEISVDSRSFVEPVTLVIAGLQKNLSEGELAVLNDFVANGGKVVVLSEKVNPDFEQGFVAKNIENNINDFTKVYGIEINNDLVYDKSNSTLTYTKQTFFGTQYVTDAYPFWPKITKENFGDNPALSKVQSLTLLWASSLKAESNDNYEVKNLITSSKNSETMSENFSIEPEQNLIFSGEGKKVLGAVASAKSGEGQVIVFGDSDFISPSFMQQGIADNEIFFMNLVDSISSDANLSSIRSKNISSRPIKELSENEKNYWKFFAIFGGAILFGVYGFVRINKRKKKSRA